MPLLLLGVLTVALIHRQLAEQLLPIRWLNALLAAASGAKALMASAVGVTLVPMHLARHTLNQNVQLKAVSGAKAQMAAVIIA